jgi:hypothetical protein
MASLGVYKIGVCGLSGKEALGHENIGRRIVGKGCFGVVL